MAFVLFLIIIFLVSDIYFNNSKATKTIIYTLKEFFNQIKNHF